jgi:hypothetical protein
MVFQLNLRVDVRSAAIVGTVCWLFYYLTHAIGVGFIGGFALIIFGIICLLVYLKGILRYADAGNRNGTLTMLGLLALMLVGSYVLAKTSGPVFWQRQLALSESDPNILLLLAMLVTMFFGFVGWIPILGVVWFLSRAAPKNPYADQTIAILAVITVGWVWVGGAAIASAVLGIYPLLQ